MIVNSYIEPFPYIIFDNFLEKKEYDEVFDEILSLIPSMQGPDGTASSFSVENGKLIYKKKGLGVWVDNVFKFSRSKSKILLHSNKIFDKNVKEIIINQDWFFKNYYPHTNADLTLLQHYGDGDYYKKHKDSSIFSAIFLFHSKPKTYSGGELFFTDYNLKIDLTDNQVIIFPAQIDHEILTIESKSNITKEGRFTITKFIFHTTDR